MGRKSLMPPYIIEDVCWSYNPQGQKMRNCSLSRRNIRIQVQQETRSSVSRRKRRRLRCTLFGQAYDRRLLGDSSTAVAFGVKAPSLARLIVSELLVGELPSFFRRRVDIELFKSAFDAATAFALRQLGAHEGFGIALVVDDVCLDCAPKGVQDSLLAKAVLDESLMELLARLLTDACKFQNLLEGL